jgi:hypothetical protein
MIVCIVENGLALLGTDSRLMNLTFSAAASDSAQKIHGVCPNTFIATSGSMRACKFQSRRAKQIAAELSTTDVRVIAAALAAETIPHLTQLVEDLKPYRLIEAGIAAAIEGRQLLHACFMIGRDATSRLGMVSQAYRVRNGLVHCESQEYFATARKITASSGAPPERLAASFGWVQDASIWEDNCEDVLRRIIRDAEGTGVSGGPPQIVCVDDKGTRWISPPPQTEPLTLGRFFEAEPTLPELFGTT